MKAPAFQFYVRDWLNSRKVQKMNGDEVKAYMYLLCESWLEEPRASLPIDDEELSLMAKLPMEKWLRVKPRVMANFNLIDNRWVNERLQGVSVKQAKFTEWGKMGGNPALLHIEPKEVNPDLNPPLNPSPNLSSSSSSSPISSTSRNIFVKPTDIEVKEYGRSIGFEIDGEHFVNHYEARGWKYNGGVSMKDWKAAVKTWKKNGNNKINGNSQKPIIKRPSARDIGFNSD